MRQLENVTFEGAPVTSLNGVRHARLNFSRQITKISYLRPSAHIICRVAFPPETGILNAIHA